MKAPTWIRWTRNAAVRRRLYLAAAIGGLLPGADARAQLQWGPNGAGGSGTWDLSTANWWNGTTNVPWNGGTAIFGGTGGMVTGIYSLNATGLTFNSLGYTLQDGAIYAINGSGTGFDFVVTTNESATINSPIGVSEGTTLVKRGSGVLNVKQTDPRGALRVEAGEYRVGEYSNLSSSNVFLANAPGVTLTLGNTSGSVSVRSLSGGGTSGGIVQPDTAARTVKMTVYGGSTFDGILQDNGTGKLALELIAISTPVETLSLTRANTYSGETTAGTGTLVFSGNGSAVLSDTVTVRSALRLDNSEIGLANRLSDNAEVRLRSGQIELIGNPTVPVQEQLGTLKYAGASTINAVQSGTEAVLSFAGAERQSHATLNVSGNGRVGWPGLVNDSAGIAGPGITFDKDWATVGADDRLQPLTSYVDSFVGATASEHVKLKISNTALAESTAVATLVWDNQTGSPGVLDIGAGRTLTLAHGGLLSSGSGANEISGGTIRTAASELVIVNRDALTIDSNITETVAGTALVKTGAGKLTLTGTNSYSGTTAITEGVLEIGSDAALGTGSTLEFNGGLLRASASFTSAKELTSGADYVGRIDTAGFEVTFSSPQTTILSVGGSGTLNLPSSTDPGLIYRNRGTLVLPQVKSGAVDLVSATLVAAGGLDKLTFHGAATLDVGGSTVASLNIKSVSGLAFYPLTIRTGVGTNSDLLQLPSHFFWSSSSPGRVTFNFEDAGGVVPGTSYTLITMASSFPPPSASLFAISPSDVAAGWKGTFTADATSVKITFSSVPEPSAAAFTAIGLLAFCGRRRRRPAGRS